jgi:outer membrane receptor protein involved in Fe transport
MAMTEKNCTPRRARASLAALSALLLLAVACTTELPTAGAIDAMDVAAGEVQAEQAGLLTPRVRDKVPLYLLDGVLVTEEEARGLTPEEIRSIEVVKAVAALRAYGEQGADGVVSIRTRSKEPYPTMAEAPLGVREGEAGTEVVLSPDGHNRAATIRENSVTFHARQVDGRSPLFIVNGEIVAESFSLSRLSPETIEAVEVIKGEAARRLYDDARAINGVIRITTRAGGR